MRVHDEVRFWRQVDMLCDGGCWLWTGLRGPKGYGIFGAGGSAHRYAYKLVVGAIPDGLTLDHLCRIRPCVNPSHLEPVSIQENIRRAVAVRTTCPQGHLFTDENTYVDPAGARRCRTCRGEQMMAPVAWDQWASSLFTCACGMTLSARNRARHERSQYHRAVVK